MIGRAAGFLSLLTEPNESFQVRAIKLLDEVVEDEWPLIADKINVIIKLGENDNFKYHNEAFLLVSKIYYHMGDLNNAVKYAIISKDAFNPIDGSNFSMVVSSHCVKAYIRLIESHQAQPPHLQKIVLSMINDLIEKGENESALYLSLETHSLDSIRSILKKDPKLVHNVLDIIHKVFTDYSYRDEVLRICLEYSNDVLDKFELCHIYHILNLPLEVSKIIIDLLNNDQKIIAYQITFDLAENALQGFISEVLNQMEHYEEIKEILTRKRLLDLYLRFLFKNNKSDIHALVALKENLKTNKMIVHSSVVISYAYMYSGTGDDNFYRNNTSWFAVASKWSQYITIAAVGTIHIGHIGTALQILEGFLIDNTPPYALGGGLFALGLIYANYIESEEALKIVLRHLSNQSKGFMIKHGAALALGLIALRSHNNKYFDMIYNLINSKEPEAGEAAGYSMGLIMLGKGPSEEVTQMLEYAKNCEHEKVVRGLAMGIAFTMYGLQEKAEVLIDQLLTDKQPLLRESAAWVISLAYVGSSSNNALQRLLHLAVSDVNADVRRAAVIGVGFVLSNNPQKVPEMLELLSKSYHPHVRSGAALAIGISCAGTGNKDAINLLEPMLHDLEDLVRQSAMIGMSMVLMQQSDIEVPYCIDFRKYLRKMISKDLSDLNVFGLCLSYGILNASGRNVVISMNSLNGDNNVLSTIGIALFCNYFYWEPLSLCLTLAFRPTAIIALNENLEIINPPIFCARNQKYYANPPTFEDEKEKVTLAPSVQLSISAKNKVEPEDTAEVKEEEDTEEDISEFCQIDLPARITLSQIKEIDLNLSTMHKPVVSKPAHGVIMFKTNDG